MNEDEAPKIRSAEEEEILCIIGAAIRKKRLERGYSLVNLAALIDVSSTYLCDVEKGRRNVSVIFLAKICKSLGITLKDIVKEAGPKKEKRVRRRKRRRK